jgi:hypothetical protein
MSQGHTEDRELPIGKMGYAIMAEQKPLLMSQGMDPRAMLKAVRGEQADVQRGCSPVYSVRSVGSKEPGGLPRSCAGTDLYDLLLVGDRAC